MYIAIRNAGAPMWHSPSAKKQGSPKEELSSWWKDDHFLDLSMQIALRHTFAMADGRQINQDRR